MADTEEQDRRHFALALKAPDPLKTYNEIKEAIEEALTPHPELDEIPDLPVSAGWFRQT